MLISLNWLKQFVDIPKKYTPQILGNLLTLRTCEVESVKSQAEGLENVVVGQILEFQKHPAAEKLHVAKVDIGKKKPLQIIFGQMVKMEIGNKIPVAIAPTKLPSGIEIEAKDLRGVTSEGMLCLDQELGLKNEGVSIMYFPDEKAGTPISKILSLDDFIFDIDNKSLTHRPDLWGHYGIAREFSAILKTKLKPYSPAQPPQSKNKPRTNLTVEIENPPDCRRFLALAIGGIKIQPTPEWMQKRLKAAGFRPVNNIVDITNYAMLETGCPMHAYDRQIVKTDRFIVRKAKNNQVLETLDHKHRNLSAQDVVIDNGKECIGLAGIMGGLASEINQNTTEIILESANWNPVTIRKTSQRLNLRSDASQRFEKDLDPVTFQHGFYRALELIFEILPKAEILSNLVDIKNYEAQTPRIPLDLAEVNRKIGQKIRPAEIKTNLTALGFEVEKSDSQKNTFIVTVPSWRATKDISHKYDLIEEIARLHGYENIAPQLPILPTNLPEENLERRRKHEARKILSLALNCNETINYSFYSAQTVKNCLLEEQSHLKIENYLSEDQTHLRTTLLPNLLKNCAENSKNRASFNLFEFGRTYKKQAAFFPIEEKWLGIIARIEKKQTSSEIFYHIKGITETFLKEFNIPQVSINKAQSAPAYFHPGKAAEITINKEIIGYIGEINPLVQINFDPAGIIGYTEINFAQLVHHSQSAVLYQPISKFPGIEFDISVLVDREMPYRKIEECIQNSHELIQKINLFDLYTGKNIPPDKKAFAFKISLQSDKRTLTDEDMLAVQKKVFDDLISAGGQIRGL